MAHQSSATGNSGRAFWLQRAMEAIVLLLVVALPWAFGGARAVFEFALYVGVAVVLGLWAVRMVVERRAFLAGCPIVLCLSGIFLLGAWQITPLSSSTLARLSPGTAESNVKLLPESSEFASEHDSRLLAGRTISLHPAGTQAQMLSLLAMVALYAAVRSNVASPGSFRRLAVVALANGSLVALVGLFQFFSSSRNLIYWTFPTEAAAFGAMNRNDFAGFANLSIGLGVGVLLARRMGRTATERAWDDPAVLWTGAGLVLMLTALGLCLSRGGVLSLLGAVAIVALVARGASGGWRLGAVVLLLALALGLAGWFGLDEMRTRMAGLWKDDGLSDDRWRMWVQTAPFARTFPVWGAGFGTFPFLERMSRSPHTGADHIQDNAHNEYLNLLLEGGAVGLVLGVAVVVFAFVLGVRAYLRHREQSMGGIALGGLLAITTLVLHSFVDYGIHLPAIAVLAAAIVAQLSALGSPADRTPTAKRVRDWFVIRFAGVAVGVAATAVVAWVLTTHGYAGQLAERYRNAAASLEMAEDADAQQRRLDYLRSAASVLPDNALAQQALADALAEHYRTERDARGLLEQSDERLEQEYLRPALQRFLRARALCPLLPRPHVALAAHSELGRESASVHLSRARLLVPYDARVWFVSGAQELKEGKRAEAWQSWRRSLERSEVHLEEIVKRSRKHLDSEALVAHVLPDDPELLSRATRFLDEDAQRPLWRRAVELARQRPDGKDDLLLLEARCLMRLGRADEALQPFERLAARSPENSDWRYEFAQALHEQGRLVEARRELRLFLATQPNHRWANELQREVVRRLSEGQ